MRTQPFKRRGAVCRAHDEQELPELSAKFEQVKVLALRLLRHAADDADGRLGFGAVYRSGTEFREHRFLTGWSWRYPDPRIFAAHLKARLFDDDPLLVAPDLHFAGRKAAAVAFAEAANLVFDPQGGAFHARAIELRRARPDTPAGLHPGADQDVLAVDLMLERRDPQIIDVMVEEEADLTDAVGSSRHDERLRLNIWHRVNRFNAARALLAPGSPAVEMPAMAGIDRRARKLFEHRQDEILRRRAEAEFERGDLPLDYPKVGRGAPSI